MRKVLAVAVAALASFGWAQTELTFWHSLDSDALRSMVQRFNESQADVRVQEVYVGSYGEAVTRIQAAVVAGRQADVMMLEITRYGLFAERGVLQPLDEYLRGSGGLGADILPGIREASRYKGRSYVIPFNSSTPLMYYNKDLFRKTGLDPERPPRTWAELAETARQLTIAGEQWGINAPPQWVRWALVKQNGGEWVDEDGRVLIDQPAAVEAYQFALDLVMRGYSSADAAIKEDVAKQLFASGKVGITFDSTGSLGSLNRIVKFDLGVAPLPCHLKCAAPIGGAALGISAASSQERQRAAWAFVEWMSRPENNAFFFTQSGYMPIRRATLDLPQTREFLARNPQWRVSIGQMSVAFPRPRPPAMPAIRQMEETVWQSMVVGQKTVQQALVDFAAEIRRLTARQ
jgi:sn-glycerol 3-phosphate transport system substrate-binding protein